MGLIHAVAECEECGKTWESRNAHGVGARHAKSTGHCVSVEVCYGYLYNYNVPDELKEVVKNTEA